jgi:carbon monoxide dehydrogenase subunit G
MDMTGERRIPASRQTVWTALNDPTVLKQSIPGCESLEKVSDSEFKAVASIKIGPISARFTGRVELTDIDPPNGYRIGGEGQGGVAGFAKGGATVALTEDGADTLLRYDVKAQVGGKIAQLGARLVDATAKSMADQFFNRFVAQIATPAPDVAAEVVTAPGTQAESAPTPVVVPPFPAPEPASVSLFSLIPTEFAGYPIVFWIGSVLFFLVFVLIFSAYI